MDTGVFLLESAVENSEPLIVKVLLSTKGRQIQIFSLILNKATPQIQTGLTLDRILYPCSGP